ncbi:MAG TPA: hypothetical protein VLS89_18905 [Candidatus Nanopelagicales bacterium]|nr:hypothetical protein [Candidatus Nanopelagicales bacterium]
MHHSLHIPSIRSIRSGLIGTIATAALLATTPALAQKNMPQVNCIDPARPNIVYIAGSSAIRNFLSVVAGLLAENDPPYSIVYQSQGSCTGVQAIFSEDPAKRFIRDIPAADGKDANYAIYFKPDGSFEECFLSPTGNEVDVGASDVYSTTCDGIMPPAGVTIADYEGPIQPMTFVVPAASQQRIISAEAGYLAFGVGGTSGALSAGPWTDPTFFAVRNASSGTQQMISRAIGVPGDKWWGEDKGGSSQVRDDLKVIVDAVSANKALGILSTDAADLVRNDLRILAFQSEGQSCSYWPDSSPFSFDKMNVRDGHYTIWGPVHFYARQGQGGLPSDAAAALVTRFAKPSLDIELLEAIIAQHLVPKCAMQVQRNSEMGPLSRYQTEYRCDCFFELIAEGSTSCQPCALPSECPPETPACNYGYCERGE